MKLMIFMSLLIFTPLSFAEDSQIFILAQCHTLADTNEDELVLNKISPRTLNCKRNLSRMQCVLSDDNKKLSEIFQVAEESKNHLLLKSSKNNYHIYVNSDSGKVTTVQTVINTKQKNYKVGTEICRGIATSNSALSKVKTSDL